MFLCSRLHIFPLILTVIKTIPSHFIKCKLIFWASCSTSLHTDNRWHDGCGHYPITMLQQSVYVICHDISALLVSMIKHWCSLGKGQRSRKPFLVRCAWLHRTDGSGTAPNCNGQSSADWLWTNTLVTDTQLNLSMPPLRCLATVTCHFFLSVN